MAYDAKLDWIDYDLNDPDNPSNIDAIPKAQDLNRIEQGIKDIDTNNTTAANVFKYNNFGGAL